jgi:hypothetical protein
MSALRVLAVTHGMIVIVEESILVTHFALTSKIGVTGINYAWWEPWKGRSECVTSKR